MKSHFVKEEQLYSSVQEFVFRMLMILQIYSLVPWWWAATPPCLGSFSAIQFESILMVRDAQADKVTKHRQYNQHISEDNFFNTSHFPLDRLTAVLMKSRKILVKSFVSVLILWSHNHMHIPVQVMHIWEKLFDVISSYHHIHVHNCIKRSDTLGAELDSLSFLHLSLKRQPFAS